MNCSIPYYCFVCYLLTDIVVPVVASVTVVVSVTLLALALVLVIATIVKAKKTPVNRKVMPL